jgi:hypothetical protein
MAVVEQPLAQMPMAEEGQTPPMWVANKHVDRLIVFVPMIESFQEMRTDAQL